MPDDPKKTVVDLITAIKDEQKAANTATNEKLLSLGTSLQATLELVKAQGDHIKAIQDSTNDSITDKTVEAQQDKLYQSNRKGGFQQPNDAEFYKSMVSEAGLTKEQMLTMEERHIEKYVPDAAMRDRIKRFQNLNDEALIVGTMLSHRMKRSAGHMAMSTILRNTTTGKALNLATKALSTSGTNQGSDWIPTVFSSQFLDLVTVQLKIAALFARINMPHSPYAIPISTSDDVAFLVGENVSDDVYTEGNTYPRFTPGTDAFTMTAIKFADITVFSEEVTEESIIPIVNFLRDKIIRSVANAEERAVIDGDTTATHMDYDVDNGDPTKIDARRAWKGLRKLAHTIGSSNEVDLSTFNMTTVRSLRAKLSDAFAEDPTNLAYIINVPTLLQMINFPELMTVDKYGDRKATIITGELGSIDGIPITTSKYMRKTLDSTGFNTNGGTNTKSVMNLVNRRGFWFGDRREMAVNTVNFVISGQGLLVATRRLTFKDIYPVNSTTNSTVVSGINITNP